MKGALRLWRSFHFRNVVIACVLSGFAFFELGGFTLTALRQANKARADAELRELTLILLSTPVADDVQWQHLFNAAHDPARPKDDPRLAMLVLDPGGAIIFNSGTWPVSMPVEQYATRRDIEDRYVRELAEYSPSSARLAQQLNSTTQELVDGALPIHRSTWHQSPILWRLALSATPSHTLLLGLNLNTHDAYHYKVRRQLWVILPLCVLGISGLTMFLSHRALRPVRVLADTAERTTAEGLDKLIEIKGQDLEFQRLTHVFNDMLSRLRRSFEATMRFSADAAHELKTPLAVLQAELEEGVHESPPGSEEQARYSRLLDQVRRLRTVTQKLLLLASADAGSLQMHTEPVNISEWVHMTCEDGASIAPEVTIDKQVAEDVMVQGDPDLLPQVVQNLIINALVHNEPDGRVNVELLDLGESVRLTVTNTGPGIAPEDAGKIFERFYRTDKSRTRGGAGLGLSLAKEIALAHGGDVTLDRSEPGTVSFSVTLPKAAPHSQRGRLKK